MHLGLGLLLHQYRDILAHAEHNSVRMKTLSLVTIGVGVLCLLAAVAGKFMGVNVLKVTPVNYVHSANALFLLALAVMYYCRCYCCKDGDSKCCSEGEKK